MHFSWLSERAGTSISPSMKAIEALGTVETFCYRCGHTHGEIKGMVGYTNWTSNAVIMHVAVATPVAARALLRPAFEYPVKTANRKVLLANILSSNTASLNICRRLGFTTICTVKQGWDQSTDLVLLELRSENCRWLEGVR